MTQILPATNSYFLYEKHLNHDLMMLLATKPGILAMALQLID